jgi:hypothetical protein
MLGGCKEPKPPYRHETLPTEGASSFDAQSILCV